MNGETQLKGIERERVAAWLAAALPQAVPPFTFRLIAAGGSNLTYRVEDARASTFVLRRPPVAGALATAHDMSREWRIMRALGAHAPQVPVPAMLAFCDDVAVTGAPFYVMEFVDGLILRDRAGAAGMDAAACSTAMRSLVATQAAFHALDPAAVGLADRTLIFMVGGSRGQSWRRQVEAAKTRDLPLLVELHERLVAAIPPETRRPGLAHGDYRFDNTVLGPDHRVRAVLDWELAHLGDPMEDLGWIFVNSWRFGMIDKPVGGFGAREDLYAGYEAISGKPVDRARARYWEVLGTLRWGVICTLSVVALREGLVSGIERGMIARRASETELDLLNLLRDA